MFWFVCWGLHPLFVDFISMNVGNDEVIGDCFCNFMFFWFPFSLTCMNFAMCDYGKSVNVACLISIRFGITVCLNFGGVSIGCLNVGFYLSWFICCGIFCLCCDSYLIL